MSGGFQYTDEQWAAIARELPEGADRAHRFVRYHMECAITDAHRGGLPDVEVRDQCRADQCQAVAIAAADENDSMFMSPPPEQPQWTAADHSEWMRIFYVQLSALAARAEWVRNFYGPIHRGPKRNAPINRLADRFIEAWAVAGGQLRTSTKNGGSGSRAAGPLIRYLIAGIKPAGVGELTEDAARECVRSHKRWEASLARASRPG
jgi:hypothetical protein